MFTPSVSCLHPSLLPITDPDTGRIFGIWVSCGKCIACKMKRTREWTIRLIMEAQDYDVDDVQFVTLTYNNESLPIKNGLKTLSKRDWQLFMKRLRKNVPDKLRFYAVGEYGLKTGRPHYHALIYGLKPKYLHFVEECWSKGFVYCENFYNETCGYVAGYIQKKLFGPDVYEGAQPPFLLCSQHLGENWFWQNVDNICKLGYIPYKGYKYGIPRIFRRKATDKGLLPPMDLEYLQILQNTEEHNFDVHLLYQHTDRVVYEDDFRINLERRFKTNNVKRDFNEVV